MAEHTIKDSLSSVAEYIGEAVATRENAFRVSTMPAASVDYAGKIYQYVGTTDASYTNGYYYECAEDNGVYGWQQINVQPGGENGQTIQYDEMPIASEDNEDDIIQYVGETTQDYTNGYFYKCIAKGTTPETYEWIENPTMDTSGSTKDSRIKTEIMEFGIDVENLITKPYIISRYIIPSFNSTSWDTVSEILDGYYSGTITLDEIQDSWKLGDYNTLSVSAIPAMNSNLTDTHAAQDVEMMIVAFNHYNKSDNSGKALLTLHMKDCFKEKGIFSIGQIPQTQEERNWNYFPRKTWCANYVYSALPNSVKESIKTVNRITPYHKTTNSWGTSSGTDTIFFPTRKELTGIDSMSAGTLYPYYTTNARRIKKVNGTASRYWGVDAISAGPGYYQVSTVASNGSDGGTTGDEIMNSTANGLAVAFCM